MATFDNVKMSLFVESLVRGKYLTCSIALHPIDEEKFANPKGKIKSQYDAYEALLAYFNAHKDQLPEGAQIINRNSNGLQVAVAFKNADDLNKFGALGEEMQQAHTKILALASEWAKANLQKDLPAIAFRGYEEEQALWRRT